MLGMTTNNFIWLYVADLPRDMVGISVTKVLNIIVWVQMTLGTLICILHALVLLKVSDTRLITIVTFDDIRS